MTNALIILTLAALGTFALVRMNRETEDLPRGFEDTDERLFNIINGREG